MPIRIPEAPPRSVAAVEATLARLLAEPQFRRRAKLVARVDQVPLSLSTPHQVFSVEVEELRRGGLDTAEPTSLRFIVLQGDRALGSAETRLDERGLPGSFANVAQGAEVEGFVDGLLRAERLPQIDEDDYELRALRVNELHLQAVWLRGASGREFIVPAEPSYPPFRSGEPLDADEFLRLVEEAARSLPDTERPVEG
jgi:hypothetical protein